jgi:hypothetical protein
MGGKSKRDPGARRGAHVQPIPPARISSNHQKPVFDLSQLRGEYCITRCTLEEKAAFVDRLHRLSQMTWAEIQIAPRHGLGTEIISRDSLGDRTNPTEMTEDVPLLAFRFMGLAPFIGYRTDRIFTVLIVDPRFTAYPH